jgi:hypothetical protein
VEGPRLFGIPALAAPIVAVLRRGPSDWSHVGRWNVERGVYEPGAWIKGNLYPQRCDVSPDGRWLCYFTLQGRVRATWAAGETYVAISRLPWLHALAAWGTAGTWTRGAHFTENREEQTLGDPDVGDTTALWKRYGMAVNRPATFAVERRRGWHESPETPPRAEHDMWDERRADHVVMRKAQPGAAAGAIDLQVQGHFAAFREGPMGTRTRDINYSLRHRSSVQPLPDTQWADWAPDGRLLIATTDGRLQIRRVEGERFAVESEVDLAPLQPAPEPAPANARRW